jgi:hypothetical protein
MAIRNWYGANMTLSSSSVAAVVRLALRPDDERRRAGSTPADRRTLAEFNEKGKPRDG